MKTLTIEVTADDIIRGVAQDPGCCPIALASQRLGMGHVAVGEDRMTFAALGLRAAVFLPRDARKFVADFDDGKHVSPFSFEVRDPRKAVTP